MDHLLLVINQLIDKINSIFFLLSFTYIYFLDYKKGLWD